VPGGINKPPANTLRPAPRARPAHTTRTDQLRISFDCRSTSPGATANRGRDGATRLAPGNQSSAWGRWFCVALMSMNVARLPTRATVSPAAVGTMSSDIPTAGCGTRFTATTFSAMCREVLGTDAGARLQEATGYPERSCYYYASGERVPPVHFILKLFMSVYGEQFFVALMEGNQAKWWQVRERHRRMGATIDSVR
jgi:hypothetical protein